MKKLVRRLLKIVGGFIAFMVVGMFAISLILRFAERKVETASAAIKPGMTIEELVQNFPHDFNFGRIVENETQPCAANGATQQLSVKVEPTKCLPPARSLSIFRPDENFRVAFSAEGQETDHQTLSGGELAKLLGAEFAGRAWHANFTYLTSTPRHYSIIVVVGPDGKVKEQPRITWMD